MNETADTTVLVSQLVADRYRAMTPTERCLAAASMFEAARTIVESSLAQDLPREQRRYAVARRLYGTELPEAALLAHANYAGSSVLPEGGGS